MADVWKAVLRGPSEFRKVFALKVLLEELSAGKDFVDVFVEEARLLGSLAHPNIVQVTDFGEEAGRYFVATEFIHGKDLDAVQKRMSSRGARLPVEIALAIGVDLARALGAAHTRVAPDGSPVLHREVFPKNVLVSYLGEVKLADFRSPRVRSVAPAKLVYRSPEQTRSEALDRRSDLFSLALLVLDLVTGTRPAEGLPRDTAAFVFPEKETASLPEQTAAVLRKGLSLDRNGRFGDAAEMEAAFTELLGAKGLLEARRSLRSTLERLFAEEMKAEAAEDPAAPLPPAAVEAPKSVVARDTVSVPLVPRKRPPGDRPSGPGTPPPPPAPQASSPAQAAAPAPEPEPPGRAPVQPTPTANTEPGLGEAHALDAMETAPGTAAFAMGAADAHTQSGAGAEAMASEEEPGTVDGDGEPPLMVGTFPGNPFDESVTETVRRPDKTRLAQPAPSGVDDISAVNPVPGHPHGDPSFKSDIFPKPKPPGAKIPFMGIAAVGGAVIAGVVGFLLVSLFLGNGGGAPEPTLPTEVAAATVEETPEAPAGEEPATEEAVAQEPTPEVEVEVEERGGAERRGGSEATRTPVVRQTPRPRSATPRPTPTARQATPRPTAVAAAGPMGELSVKSTPFVIVWLDGRKLKATPLLYKLPAGPHKLRFVNEEVDLEKNVQVPVNGRVSVTIDLESGRIEVR